MRVAIFAEGRSDFAVLANILKGRHNIDKSDIRFEVPEYEYDETDLHSMDDAKHGGWSRLKKACIDRKKFQKFIENSEPNSFIVIQIDAFERIQKGYDVNEPVKDNKNLEQFNLDLRKNIKSKLNDWLKNNYEERIAYAICIEEMDAWILTIHENKETSKHNDPKKHFKNKRKELFSDKYLKKLSTMSVFDEYDSLSRDFRKNKNLENYTKINLSLKHFCLELDEVGKTT